MMNCRAELHACNLAPYEIKPSHLTKEMPTLPGRPRHCCLEVPSFLLCRPSWFALSPSSAVPLGVPDRCGLSVTNNTHHICICFAWWCHGGRCSASKMCVLNLTFILANPLGQCVFVVMYTYWQLINTVFFY